MTDNLIASVAVGPSVWSEYHKNRDDISERLDIIMPTPEEYAMQNLPLMYSYKMDKVLVTTVTLPVFFNMLMAADFRCLSALFANSTGDVKKGAFDDVQVEANIFVTQRLSRLFSQAHGLITKATSVWKAKDMWNDILGASFAFKDQPLEDFYQAKGHTLGMKRMISSGQATRYNLGGENSWEMHTKTEAFRSDLNDMVSESIKSCWKGLWTSVGMSRMPRQAIINTYYKKEAMGTFPLLRSDDTSRISKMMKQNVGISEAITIANDELEIEVGCFKRVSNYHDVPEDTDKDSVANLATDLWADHMMKSLWYSGLEEEEEIEAS